MAQLEPPRAVEGEVPPFGVALGVKGVEQEGAVVAGGEALEDPVANQLPQPASTGRRPVRATNRSSTEHFNCSRRVQILGPQLVWV